MAAGLTPIRRVVTGNDERGRSKVAWDGPAPNAHQASMGAARGHTDLWVWNETPAPLAESVDAGNLAYVFPGPDEGGHLRELSESLNAYRRRSAPALDKVNPLAADLHEAAAGTGHASPTASRACGSRGSSRSAGRP